MRNLGLWNLKKKYHGSVNFCSIFEKMVLMCSKNEEDYIYVPQIFIHHQLKVGGGGVGGIESILKEGIFCSIWNDI